MNNSFSEQVLYVDSLIIEIEIFFLEEYKFTVYKDKNVVFLEFRDCLQKLLFISTIVVYIFDFNIGYKFQIFNFFIGGNFFGNGDEIVFLIFGSVVFLDLGKNVRVK